MHWQRYLSESVGDASLFYQLDKVRVRRDFLRGKSTIHRRVPDSMAVMLAIALGYLEKNKPDKMRSLVTPLAA